jgi:hypothetical protein
MHYHAEIFINNLLDIDAEVEKIMAPFDENLDIEEKEDEDGDKYWHNPNGFWDWFQIGGRWSGVHTGYDPSTDKDNYEKCFICEGTGFRNDRLGVERRSSDPSYTCNGCGERKEENGVVTWAHGKFGPGLTLKFQSNFKRYFGDVINVSDIKDDFYCYTLMVGKECFHKEVWNGETFVNTEFDGNVKGKLLELNITKGYLVTVDYHT